MSALSRLKEDQTQDEEFSPKHWVTTLNCNSKGKFREDVSDTSSSVISQNSSEDDSSDKQLLTGFPSRYSRNGFNQSYGRAGLYITNGTRNNIQNR